MWTINAYFLEVVKKIGMFVSCCFCILVIFIKFCHFSLTVIKPDNEKGSQKDEAKRTTGYEDNRANFFFFTRLVILKLWGQ